IKGRVDAEDLEGKTPLHYACEGVGDGTDKIVRNLLKAGAEINKQARDGSRPIHCAAESGAVETLRTLAEAGAIVDSLDVMGKTPLMLAALGAHKDAVEVLIGEYHVDKETPDGAGWRPLHCAVWAGRYDMVKLLIEEYGVDRESQTKVGWTPLFVAAAIDRGLALVRPLMEHQGIDVDARDVDGRTALMTAIRMGMEGTMRMLVLELGADVNARDNQGQTPLHNAMKLSANHAAVSAEVLLGELGADVHARSRRGDTPLHIAARQGHREVMLKLIQEFGADA
ncbi:ankyrin repeat-containing domain protein, partial [Fusarium tricinctum]